MFAVGSRGVRVLALALVGLGANGCLKVSLDSTDGLVMALRPSGTSEPNKPAPPPPPTSTRVSCDLRMIHTSDASVTASVSGESAVERMSELAKAAAGKFRDEMPIKGESLAVVSLRNRSATSQGKVVADELADKLVGALVELGWFQVKERIDLRAIVGEKDLDAAGMVRNEAVKQKLAGVRYVVIGGVTVTEGKQP
jgi:curli biogenesis system outer membrane secretion channel CsgG